jgi:hypothetical protein
MLEFLDTPDSILALKLTGSIKGADLDAIMDRLDAAFERHEIVHIFVETQGIDGIEIAGLPSYAARALPLFGKLKRFGRVAVVADQAWVRIGAQIESAILPFISYRTYEPEDRAKALTWVISAKEPAEA